MKQYLDSLQYILDNGKERKDRTGTGTIGVFGLQSRYNLAEAFPAVTTKKLAWRAVVSELLWFIEGTGDERRLAEILHGTRDESKRTIWTANAQADYWKGTNGNLGRVYGVQWRSWRTFNNLGSNSEDALLVGNYKEVDQLAELIQGLKEDPYSRRHILTAWNPGELDQMALPPCHLMAQFYVEPYTFDERMARCNELYPTINTYHNGYYDKEKMLEQYKIPVGKLSCQMYQRSADMFLGVPFNIASYSLFTHMIAQVTNLDVGEFVHTIGDAHIYSNHVDQVKEQLTRTPKELPTLKINSKITNINKFTMADFELVDYEPMESIKAEMAV